MFNNNRGSDAPLPPATATLLGQDPGPEPDASRADAAGMIGRRRAPGADRRRDPRRTATAASSRAMTCTRLRPGRGQPGGRGGVRGRGSGTAGGPRGPPVRRTPPVGFSTSCSSRSNWRGARCSSRTSSRRGPRQPRSPRGRDPPFVAMAGGSAGGDRPAGRGPLGRHALRLFAPGGDDRRCARTGAGARREAAVSRCTTPRRAVGAHDCGRRCSRTWRDCPGSWRRRASAALRSGAPSRTGYLARCSGRCPRSGTRRGG